MGPEGEDQPEPFAIRGERPAEHELYGPEGRVANAVSTFRHEPRGHSRFKRNCLLVILGCSLAHGILVGLTPWEEFVPPFFAVPVIIAALCWCIRDANEHGERLGHLWRAVILFVTPVGVVVYLLLRRRIGSLAKSIAFCLLCALIIGITGLTTYRLHWGTWPEG